MLASRGHLLVTLLVGEDATVGEEASSRDSRLHQGAVLRALRLLCWCYKRLDDGMPLGRHRMQRGHACQLFSCIRCDITAGAAVLGACTYCCKNTVLLLSPGNSTDCNVRVFVVVAHQQQLLGHTDGPICTASTPQPDA